jgi:Ni,Fe-hydrogenase I cytochrome b subunit
MVVIIGLLATVLLRKTFLSWSTNSALIEDKLKGAITPEMAKEIAVAIRNPLWDWHIYLGFTLASLLLCRILIALFVEKSCPGLEAFKNVLKLKDLPAGERIKAAHYSLVKISYAVFYLAVAFMVLTGFTQYFKAELGLSKNIISIVKDAHELMMWLFVVFGCAHIVGVIIAENRQDSGIISDMVNGGRRQ